MKNKVLMYFIVFGLAIVLTACGKQEAATPDAGISSENAMNHANGGSMDQGSTDMGDSNDNHSMTDGDITYPDDTAKDNTASKDNAGTVSSPEPPLSSLPSATDDQKESADKGTAPSNSPEKPSEPPKETPPEKTQSSESNPNGTAGGTAGGTAPAGSTGKPSEPPKETPPEKTQSSESNSNGTAGGTAGGTAPAGSTGKPSEPLIETPPQQTEPSGGNSGAAEKQNDQQEAKVYTVEIKNFDYAPKEMTVPLGSKITFTNRDSVEHTATVDGEFDSGYLKKDESYTVTLNKAGEYAVYCKPHPFMKLKITVK